MNVLSLFDGMSCGQIALQRANIRVDTYFASEIDVPAITLCKRKYPNTVQVGSVTNLIGTLFPKTDLLIGGSPCQGFSSSGIGLNFEDPRSKLFFDFVRILKQLREKNPGVKFLLENVKMRQEWADIITDTLEVQPIEINSALVSAHSRRRLYWTNINGGGVTYRSRKIKE